jgi:hypothetical protein
LKGLLPLQNLCFPSLLKGGGIKKKAKGELKRGEASLI